MNPNQRDRLLNCWFFAAIAHLVVSVGLWWAGFLYGMRSFNESGAGDIAGFLFRLQALLNFPVVFIERDRLLQEIGRSSTVGDIWERGIGPYPSGISFLWSVIFGLLFAIVWVRISRCLLYTSPSPRDLSTSRMPSSA